MKHGDKNGCGGKHGCGSAKGTEYATTKTGPYGREMDGYAREDMSVSQKAGNPVKPTRRSKGAGRLRKMT